MPKAVVCRELGPPARLRLETFASAPLAAGRVRVAIHAAGINFPDILMAAGEYQLKPELPFTPGVEAAGEGVEFHGTDGVAVGERVIVKMRHGGYADEAVVTPSQLVPLPSTFDYAEGATFLAAHGTAYHALIDRGRIQPDEVLLVHGADLVFDPVGGEVFENSLRCIAWGARILVIGFTGGIGLARTHLLMIKGGSGV